ncbi:MAG: hypothetical protein E7Z87_04135 [Cyanobacteria bacterium SIG26]|nr:hypothetical protein [Cyanobacteria bacterium SIG26]
MIDNHNILLITDYDEIAKNILEKLVLLRANDNITVCDTKSFKKIIENSMYYVIILHENEDKDSTIKLIKQIKDIKQDCEILLLLNKTNKETILEAYDSGIFDYFTINTENYEMLIKTVNCFKFKNLKEINCRNDIFLNQLGVLDAKLGIYNQKHLKEIFIDLSDYPSIKNGVFVILTLDESTKTKVSTNRLGQLLKNMLRKDDIIAIGRGGKYFLILPNINILNTKAVIQKIQEKMGQDCIIRAGISKIGIQSFETICKNATNALTSACHNNKNIVCLENNIDKENIWLEDQDSIQQKGFKLFKTALSNKLENIITPLFYRFQKDCQSKLKNTTVSQYTNDIECVFCLKNQKSKSELLLQYDGFTKFNIEIIHSGLNSAENSKFELGLNKITNKLITNLLKQLKEEYILSTKKED